MQRTKCKSILCVGGRISANAVADTSGGVHALLLAARPTLRDVLFELARTARVLGLDVDTALLERVGVHDDDDDVESNHDVDPRSGREIKKLGEFRTLFDDACDDREPVRRAEREKGPHTRAHAHTHTQRHVRERVISL